MSTDKNREAWEEVPVRQSTAGRKAEEFLKGEKVRKLLDAQAMQPTPTPITEVRMTSETGGSKGSKLSQLGFAAPEGLRVLGEVCGFGAQKYDPTNYRKGYKWSLSYNALMRHTLAFLAGEDLDPESGLPHMAHAAWHCIVLVQYMKDYPEYDDRYKGGE